MGPGGLPTRAHRRRPPPSDDEGAGTLPSQQRRRLTHKEASAKPLPAAACGPGGGGGGGVPKAVHPIGRRIPGLRSGGSADGGVEAAKWCAVKEDREPVVELAAGLPVGGGVAAAGATTQSGAHCVFELGPPAEEVCRDLCMARTWAGGFGGQCKRKHGTGAGDLCNLHARQEPLGHGRVDGPVPAAKLQEMRRAVESAGPGAAAPSATRRGHPSTSSSGLRGGRPLVPAAGARWLSDGEEEEPPAGGPTGGGIRRHRRLALSRPAPAAPPPGGSEHPSSQVVDREDLVLAIGDFVFASPSGSGCGIGEVCGLYEDAHGDQRTQWRRFLSPEELPFVPTGDVELHEREVVETDQVLELGVASLRLPAAGGGPAIEVVSAKEWREKAGKLQTVGDLADEAAVCQRPAGLESGLFCGRALYAGGSGVLWEVAWDSSARADRRRAALLAAALASREASTAAAPAPAAVVPPPSAALAVEVSSSAPRQRLARAAAALRPGGGEGGLPGRSSEQAEVSAFLRDAVRAGGQAQVLYISGMPGTGKTACVLEAARALQRRPRRGGGGGPTFSLVHVNAMCLSWPGAIFAEICQKLPALCCRPQGGRRRGRAGGAAGAGLTPQSEVQAYTSLSRFFSAEGVSSTRAPVVLLVDEVDCLMTQAQAVLYRLFEWLSKPHARLAVVAIANTMDLPERLLPRVASRLGVLRVNFNPYTRGQLREILDERLREADAQGTFEEDALTLAAARVAAQSGDARKVLQVCRRAAAAQLAETYPGPVTTKQIRSADEDLLRANPAAKAIPQLNLRARQLLLAIVLELRRRPPGAALPLRAAERRYEGIMTLCERRDRPDGGGARAEAEPVEPPRPAERRYAEDVHFNVQRLETMSLLRVHAPGRGDGPEGGAIRGYNALSTLELGQSIDADDVADALASDPEDDLARELLGCTASSLTGAAGGAC